MTIDVDVACALAVTVVDEPPAEGLARWLSWAAQIWGVGIDDAPLSVIHDLGFLLLRGRAVRLCSGRERFAFQGLSDATRSVIRAERLRFEDRILALALRDDRMMSASVVIGGAAVDKQDPLIVHALSAVLPRLLHDLRLPPHQAGPLRSLAERCAAAALSANDADAVAIANGDSITSLLQAMNDDVTAVLDPTEIEDQALDLGMIADAHPLEDDAPAKHRPSVLLRAEELWELAHLDQVPAEAMRLALRTVHRTMAAIGVMSPTMAARLADRRADAVTDDTAADAFPAGGFDAMSTQGVLENLVRSEVAYVGVGAEDDPALPDLFDVRFVEGELLYYTRDESPLLERRRHLVVVIEEAERLRHKLSELPTQTLVLVEAVALQAHADLVLALGPHLVSTTIAVGGADADAVTEERGLLLTTLHTDIAHRRASVVEIADAPTGRRVTFSPRPRPATTAGGAGRLGLWVRVGAALWQIDDGDRMIELDPNRDLRALVDRLMLLA